MNKIKIAIVGYGNLGRGVQLGLGQNPDMELVGIFTRRSPEHVKPVKPTKVYHIDDLNKFKDEVDVAILCGGSATDLPEQSPKILEIMNTVDSFDTHAKIPEFFEVMDRVGKESGKLGAISIGWDPGLFSIVRSLFMSFLPSGETYTFWGKGVSQGHSDAIRRVDGVKYGVQYTVPVEAAIDSVRKCENPKLQTRDKHLRECYVVLDAGADAKRVEHEIKTMPNYFADYNTVVHFISEEEMEKNHSSMPHGGFVLRSGVSAGGSDMLLELAIKLKSNPEFTSSVLISYARAVYNMRREGKTGAVTALDIAPKYLSSVGYAELLKNLV